jgi:DNA-binding transcriptional LysR family regulator
LHRRWRGFWRHPDIALDLDLSDDFVDLIASRYDVALRITAPD